MLKNARKTIGLALAMLLAACSPPPPSGKSANVEPVPSPAAPPVAELPPEPVASSSSGNASYGSMVVYSCDDGKSLTVTYDEHSALVKLPTGSTTLSRAEEISGEGRDAYLGEELSLYREGDAVQLDIAGKSRICTQTPINS